MTARPACSNVVPFVRPGASSAPITAQQQPVPLAAMSKMKKYQLQFDIGLYNVPTTAWDDGVGFDEIATLGQ